MRIAIFGALMTLILGVLIMTASPLFA